MARDGITACPGCVCGGARHSLVLAEGESVTTSNRRRIVRRALMVLAGAVLLLAGYVGSSCVLEWLIGRETVDHKLPREWLIRVQDTGYAPIVVYYNTELPGAVTLKALAIWCSDHGRGTPQSFGDCVNIVMDGKNYDREMRSRRRK